ncbi:MAG: hypothetical protein DI619_03305 [Francisella sp.]|nr:MAG: hypothetical protein DI619_03305 [Francisella sp.]
MQSLVKAGFYYDLLACEKIKLQGGIASHYKSWRLNAEGVKHFHDHALCRVEYFRWCYHSQPTWHMSGLLAKWCMQWKLQLDQWAKEFFKYR